MRDDSSAPTVRHTWQDVRRAWRTLVLTALAFQMMAFALLMPLVSVTFRWVIAMSGSAVLSDVDIAKFLFGPVGLVGATGAGALWLGVYAFELAALTEVLAASAAQQPISFLSALRFALAHAPSIVRVAARVIAVTLVTSAPFLAVAGATYFSLLSRYDINYYLQVRPPEWLTALGVGAVLVLSLAALLLWMFAGWLFALPLVVLENVHPAQALRESRTRSRGDRLRLLLWLAGWAALLALASAFASGMVAMIGRLLVPRATSSLQTLAAAIGATLLLWFLANLAVNIAGSTSLAAVLFHLYRRWGSQGHVPILYSPTEPSGRVRLTTGRLISALVISVLTASTVGALAVQSIQLENRAVIMAHRGASHAAPENTLAAIQQAIDDGADWVEIDVQETADGEVVVFHDSDFMKLARRDLKIWDATRDDLRAIDIGSWFAPDFRDQRVPTLAEVLTTCRGRVGVNIELKYYGHDKQLEQRVAEIVEAHDMAREVMVMSLQIEGVRKMKALRPDWRVGLLMSVAAGKVSEIDADFLAVNARFVTRGLVQKAHAARKQVFVWTVNDAATMSTMIGRGVDGLLTDRPALARRVLKQRAEMSVPERLLVELSGIFGVPSRIGEP